MNTRDSRYQDSLSTRESIEEEIRLDLDADDIFLKERKRKIALEIKEEIFDFTKIERMTPEEKLFVVSEYLKKDWASYIVENLEFFPESLHREICLEIAKRGEDSLILVSNIEKFFLDAYDFFDVVKTLIKYDKKMTATAWMNLLDRTTATIPEQLPGDLKDKFKEIFDYDNEDYGVIYIIMQEMDMFAKYHGMKNFLLLFDNEEKKQLFKNKRIGFVDQDKAMVRLENFEKKEQMLTSKQFLECMELVGFSVEPDRKRKIEQEAEKEEKRREKEEKTEDMYGEIDLIKESIRFYLNVWLLYLNDLKEEKKNVSFGNAKPFFVKTKELPFNYQVYVRDIKEEVNKIFDWIKKYLIKAIFSESGDMNSRNAGFCVDIKNFSGSIEDLITKGTPEQKSIFLMRAKEIFSTYINQEGRFGGPAWEKIVELAEAMWSMDDEEQTDDFLMKKIMLIDRAFQIEHSGGSVFSKDVKNTKFFSQAGLRRILDVKFRSKSIDEMANDLKETIKNTSNFETEKAINRLIDERVKKIHNLERITARGRGSD